MYTLSISEARAKLAQAVSTFEGVSAYKVEFGLWDYAEQPYVGLYVNCSLNGENQFIHARGNTFSLALEELTCWYNRLAREQLVLLCEDLLSAGD